MPLVRVAIPAGKGEDFARTVSECVHDALVSAIAVPPHDRFQIVTEHVAPYLVNDPEYLGIERSADAMIVQISLRKGRSPDLKRALYAAITANLETRLRVRPQDVLIVLGENDKVDWSFGNGVAQYEPAPEPASGAGPAPAWQAFAPKLASLTSEVLFGDVWERGGLSKRDRSLITCAILTALVRPEQLRFHLQRAVENGVSQDELGELVTHAAFYAGWPAAITAATVASEAFATKAPESRS